eukprot:TRINITY_DN6127_c0_g2_i1.p1 TRINITY_DN6127_c0_g2~~TRINITY_DN6127_c0_g2_i1.p1  ORF type:complete len:233 (+),score=55.21 TRINITY_DN6127_c0_g2_i1:24-701(+)
MARPMKRLALTLAATYMLRSWPDISVLQGTAFSSCSRVVRSQQADSTKLAAGVPTSLDDINSFEVGRRALIAASAPALLSMTHTQPATAAAADVAAARQKFDACSAQIDDLLKKFDAIAASIQVRDGGGDKIVNMLRGPQSPCDKFDKNVLPLVLEAQDSDAFQSALDEFVEDAELAYNGAYNANFAGGSGNPKNNSPQAFLAKSKASTKEMRVKLDKMKKALGS